MTNNLDAYAVRDFIKRYRRLDKTEPLRFKDSALGIQTIFRDIDSWHTTYCLPHCEKLIRWYKNVPFTIVTTGMPYYIVLHDLKTNQIVRCGGEIKQDWTCIPMLFHDLDAMIRRIPAGVMAKLTNADKAVLGMTRDFSCPRAIENRYRIIQAQ